MYVHLRASLRVSLHECARACVWVGMHLCERRHVVVGELGASTCALWIQCLCRAPPARSQGFLAQPPGLRGGQARTRPPSLPP